MRRALGMIIVTLGLTGCANTDAMRTLATQAKAHVDAQNKAVTDFVAIQGQINSGAAGGRRDLDEMAAGERRTKGLLVQGWEVQGDHGRVEALGALSSRSAEDILNGMIPVALSTTRLDDGGAGDSLETASTQFGLLARKPSQFEQLQEAFSAADTVYTAWDKLKKAAVADSAKTSPPTPTPGA